MRRLQRPAVTPHLRYHLFWATALAVAGLLAAPLPAHAAGTAAGTSISNRATATYIDPNNPGQTLNATSNTVTITVAEVAGITISGLGVTDSTPATGVLPGDVLTYDFRVTNVGNDPTAVALPGAANVTGPGAVGTMQYSLNGGTTWTNVPGAGVTTTSVAAGGTVLVRVPVTVNAAAPSGAPITVRLGDTPPNDNSANTQNQAFAAGTNDLRTSDNADGTAGEATGSPANGEREASFFQQILVGAQPQAFAALLKTRTGVSDSRTAALNDDLITYGLSVRVDAAAPTGAPPSLVAGNLVATAITLGGSSQSRILVSDAIPVSTVLNAAPTAPAGWTAVYTVTATSTAALSAAWTTTAPADLTTVTRVGFVHNGPITTGTTVSGFAFVVRTAGVPAAGATLANIAQLFGQTNGGGSTLVYDESGDPMASNFDDDGSVGSNSPTNGVANTATDGIDGNNDNTGTGPGGEDNVYTLAPPGSILNGPNGAPGAVGPTDSNDDFTNRSAPVAAGTGPGSMVDPAAITFTNTLQNPGAAALSNILLVPTPPSSATALPTGTTVALTVGGVNTATYTYSSAGAGSFTFTSGTAISIGSLAAGASMNYTVTVNLPANTPLSTDSLVGYPAPVRAFIDADLDGSFDAGEGYNITIDRIYTGFVRAVKEARILDTDGATEVQTWSTAPTTANIRPGRFVQYRITYTNVSSTPSGAGNVLLLARNLVITEDGTVLPNNWAEDQDSDGALDTSNVVGQAIDSAGSATIAYFSGDPATPGTPSPDQTGTTAATDVTRYLVSLTDDLAPGETRTFTFLRRIN